MHFYGLAESDTEFKGQPGAFLPETQPKQLWLPKEGMPQDGKWGMAE
jgi:hypothetical protein